MLKLKTLIFCSLIILLSCTNKAENNETKNELTFGDFVNMEKLDKVEMSNNSGTFNLNNNQIEKLKTELSNLVYDPNISVKVGAINIELTIDGKTFNVSSATHGDYLEVHKDNVTKNKNSIETSDWLYFKTGKVNFDNYINENQ